MNFEKERMIVLYKRLLSLYPQDFRVRFGESMQQTFNDVCSEQKKRKGKVSLTFAVSIFADVSVGIIRENLHGRKGAFMNSIYARIIYSMVIGLLATVPFVIMEWRYSNGFPQGVPYAVFNFLFVTAAIFAFLVFSAARTPFKDPLKEWILSFALKILAAIPLVLAWTHMVSDQMPCFLGGRGC